MMMAIQSAAKSSSSRKEVRAEEMQRGMERVIRKKRCYAQSAEKTVWPVCRDCTALQDKVEFVAVAVGQK